MKTGASEECRVERAGKNMKRKITILTLCAMLLALCGSVDAQQTGKVARIGFLDPSTASGMAVLVDAFRQELHKLGWIKGKNLTIEYRFANQKRELRELAEDLLHLKVDLIVVSGTPPASAAKNATVSIPIVMTTVGDPVGARFGCQFSAAGRQRYEAI